MKNLTHGKPIKLILLFAIPLFIGQLFQLFYSLVDTRIVGSVLGDESLAAVGATSSLSEMLLSLLNGFTNGFALVIATLFGANDTKNMKKAVGGTVLLGVISSICISVVCLLFLSPILRFMNVMLSANYCSAFLGAATFSSGSVVSISSVSASANTSSMRFT